MRRAVGLLLLPICALVAAQSVEMRVLLNGTDAGTGTYSYKKTAGGGVEGTLIMSISGPGVDAKATMGFAFDGKGRPLTYTMSMSGQGAGDSLKVMYGKAHVTVVEVKNGRKSTRRVEIPKGRKINSEASLWFVSKTPKVGQTDSYWEYDVQTGKWTPEKSTYVGPKKITIGGRTVTAHEIRETETLMWVDAQGLPYKIISEDPQTPMILERVM
jgi:hypothetical protein